MLQAKTQIMAEKRVSMGWSKSDLAAAAKLNHSIVARAEQGRGTSPRSAKAIADSLGMSVLDLFTVKTKRED